MITIPTKVVYNNNRKQVFNNISVCEMLLKKKARDVI